MNLIKKVFKMKTENAALADGAPLTSRAVQDCKTEPDTSTSVANWLFVSTLQHTPVHKVFLKAVEGLEPSRREMSGSILHHATGWRGAYHTIRRRAPSAPVQKVPFLVVAFFLLPTFFILFFPFFAPLAQASATLATPDNTGLVGYWSFDSSTINGTTVKDMSGQKHNGTMVGSPTSVPGILNQALNFNGSTSYTDLGSSPSLISAGTRTVAFWIKPTTDSGYLYTQFDGAGTNYGGKNLVFNGSNIQLSWQAAGLTVVSASTVPLNQWTHVVGVFNANGNVGSIYLNGVLSNSGSIGAEWTSNPNDLRVCGRWATPNTGSAVMCTGTIDEVRIYNRALTAGQVAALYNDTKANHVAAANTTTLSTGLVGYWTLDGSKTNWATGKTLDSSGQNNTGSLISMSTSTSPVEGKIGQALKFNGNASIVNIPDVANSYAFPNTTFTVSSWIKTTTNVGSFILTKDDGGTAVGWGIGVNSAGNFSVNSKGNGGTIASSRVSTVTVNDNKWHHVVAVFTTNTSVQASNDVTLYVDGVLNEGSLTNSTTYVAPTLPVTIGERSSGNLFSGAIDDVRIYNRALSAAEVKQLYLLGK
jgi:hypothetical protein